MGNSLLIYLNKRLHEESSYKKEPATTAGPVITISREVGCNGLKLANLMAEKFNREKMETDWKVLSKEIFYKSAKELDLEPERVRKMLKQTDRYTFDEILKAFQYKQFKSERKITKTVYDVVRSFSIDGFCIIVGRAGHIIAGDIKNALHLRLVAPFDYRVKVIMENNKLSREEATVFIQHVEKERIAFRKAILQGRKVDDFFDLTINRASFSDEKVVDIVECAAKEKGLLNLNHPRMEFY
ncbi:MAG: cytidylate kinase-like family protein [Prolixibacteraceae bacterium]|nr:cytidylate kinase-like family protein [Prolixibacteraceae bacterium]